MDDTDQRRQTTRRHPSPYGRETAPGNVRFRTYAPNAGSTTARIVECASAVGGRATSWCNVAGRDVCTPPFLTQDDARGDRP